MKKLVLALACAIASVGSHAQAPTPEVSRVVSTVQQYTQQLQGTVSPHLDQALHPDFYATGFNRAGQQQKPMNPTAFLEWVKTQNKGGAAPVQIREVWVKGQKAQVKLEVGAENAPRLEQLTLQKEGDQWKIVTFFYSYS